VRLGAWQVPAVFRWLQAAGGVPQGDMLRTFNMGIGLILIVARGDADASLRALAAAGETGAVRIGEIAAGRGQVVYS
jgi:phosphoribosylformylglycinamidine cyclo-ligase